MLSNIEAERARIKLTKEEMADELNVSERTYYNWINEVTDVPGSVLKRMAKLFNKSVDYLLEIEDRASKAS